MNATPVTHSALNWLLDEIVDRVPRIRHTVLLSSDGLATAVSGSLGREDAEHLAAVASGIHSLAKGAGLQFHSGRVRQSMVEFDETFLFITAAGEGSCLAVLSDATADPGQIAFEMALLVKRVGEHMGTAARRPTPGPESDTA
ncbi:roadblock/LC7 domain-containing protein [Streptomyces sp. NPDC003023]|uniref:roadblock/LC7 domain-containing protein n=1 Tax=Streptomyces sp. NPDC003023 TaxID=3364675 RepID=UPI0036AD8803